jgi:hypothetical protein
MEDTMTKACDYIVHWVAIKVFFFQISQVDALARILNIN